MLATSRTRILVTLATAAVLLAACGKQDLYEPPGAPYEVTGRLPLPSASQAVAVLGTHAFVAGGEAGLYGVDFGNHAAPQLLSMTNTTKSADGVNVVRIYSGGRVRDIAHVVEGTEGITSYDVTDPASVFDFHTGTTAVVGQSAYVAQTADPAAAYTVFLAEDWKGVRIFDSIPADPGILAYNGVFVGTLGKAYSIEVRDGWGYVADDEMGLVVLDLRVLDLDSVSIASWADTPGNARAVALWGDYAFVADGVAGLAVFRIHEGDTPVKVAQLDLSGFSEAIALRDGLMALSANSAGTHFVDVRNPAAPVYLGTIPSGYATGVAFAEDGTCVICDEDDGLLICTGHGPFRDLTAPSPVTTLAAAPAGASSIRLSWVMTGDDRMVGTASNLEVRRSDAPIVDDTTWEAATPVAGAPAPEAPGTAMSLVADGLTPGVTYHFALRVTDDAGNVSDLSNDASTATAEGIILVNPQVDVGGGTTSDTYTFSVEALFEGTLTASEVVIDGTPHAMTLADGFYSYATTLAPGVHSYHFHFAGDGVGDATTEEFEGPYVGEIAVTLGSPASESGRRADEARHVAVFSHDVQGGTSEVTQAEWDAVMPAGSNPSEFPGADRPVDSVTWFDAIMYCNARSTADGTTPCYTIDADNQVTWNRDADGWRLPTEAEWEYLCRAGTTTAFYTGALTELYCRLDPVLDAIGWYCGNAGTGTSTVAQKQANAWGLYDTSGNVREWCWDWYGEALPDAALDPAGPDTGTQRVCRGGSWYYSSQDCRSAARGTYYPTSRDNTVGMRAVRTVFEN